MDQFDSTCWSMITGAALGKEEDRDLVARRYGPLISRYLAMRWRLPQDHEKVAEANQETMVQLFKPKGALSSVDPERPGGFRAYLYGVVRNVALMMERGARRHRRVHQGSHFDLEDIAVSEATLSEAFDRGWVQMIATEARILLAEKKERRMIEAYRCLGLRYTEGLPAREIADRIGQDVQVVYELLRTARNGYRAALLEVMGYYHPECSEKELEEKCQELTQYLQ